MIAGLEYPIIEPHAQPVRPQAFGEGAYDVFVFAAVAQEYVVVELVCHRDFLWWLNERTEARAGDRRLGFNDLSVMPLLSGLGRAEYKALVRQAQSLLQW